MWNPVHLPANFEAKTLPPRIYIFNHPAFGRLTISRRAKGAATNQVIFDLQLTPLGGGAVINDNCSAYVDNNDANAMMPPIIGLRGPHQPAPALGASTIGYSMIDISSMGGMRIIYLCHYAMADAGREIGVSNFVVENIVNQNLNNVCTNCGMRYSNHPAGYQGICSAVKSAARARANVVGWV